MSVFLISYKSYRIASIFFALDPNSKFKVKEVMLGSQILPAFTESVLETLEVLILVQSHGISPNLWIFDYAKSLDNDNNAIYS